jgi:hypothetical protein
MLFFPRYDAVIAQSQDLLQYCNAAFEIEKAHLLKPKLMPKCRPLSFSEGGKRKATAGDGA